MLTPNVRWSSLRSQFHAMATDAAKQDAILQFWFGAEYPAKVKPNYDLWFGGSPETDALIKGKFGADVSAAEAGQYASWVDAGPHSCLALVLLLDQFSLNVYRDEARGYECSKLMVPVSYTAVGRGYVEKLPDDAKMFMLLPIEHSERLDDQVASVRLHKECGLDPEYAIEHYDVVAKYGRFPGRNKCYGRETTDAEKKYFEDVGVF